MNAFQIRYYETYLIFCHRSQAHQPPPANSMHSKCVRFSNDDMSLLPNRSAQFNWSKIKNFGTGSLYSIHILWMCVNDKCYNVIMNRRNLSTEKYCFTKFRKFQIDLVILETACVLALFGFQLFVYSKRNAGIRTHSIENAIYFDTINFDGIWWNMTPSLYIQFHLKIPVNHSRLDEKRFVFWLRVFLFVFLE